MTRRRRAHRARPARPRFSARHILLAAAALLIATSASLSTVGGTYAYLSASRSVPLLPTDGSSTATITAGTAVLTASSAAISLSNLYPGDSRTAAYTLTNSGTVPLALSVASITGPSTANGLAATLAPGACPGTATGVSAGPLGATVAAGASATVCLAVSMAASAPSSAQSLPTSVVVTVRGTQS